MRMEQGVIHPPLPTSCTLVGGTGEIHPGRDPESDSSKQLQFQGEEEMHDPQTQLLPGSAKVSAVAEARSRRQLDIHSAGREKA